MLRHWILQYALDNMLIYIYFICRDSRFLTSPFTIPPMSLRSNTTHSTPTVLPLLRASGQRQMVRMQEYFQHSLARRTSAPSDMDAQRYMLDELRRHGVFPLLGNKVEKAQVCVNELCFCRSDELVRERKRESERRVESRHIRVETTAHRPNSQ